MSTAQQSTTNLTTDIEIANVIDTEPLALSQAAQAEATLVAAVIQAKTAKDTAAAQKENFERGIQAFNLVVVIATGLILVSMFRKGKKK